MLEVRNATSTQMYFAYLLSHAEPVLGAPKTGATCIVTHRWILVVRAICSPFELANVRLTHRSAAANSKLVITVTIAGSVRLHVI